MEAYLLAQRAIADLKGAILQTISKHPDGISNADLGRSLGIYAGHIRHEGHIPRTMLAIMESEGVVQQDEESKLWTLRNNP